MNPWTITAMVLVQSLTFYLIGYMIGWRKGFDTHQGIVQRSIHRHRSKP